MCSLIHNNKRHVAYALKTPYQIDQIEDLTSIAWDIMARLSEGLKTGMTGKRIEAGFVKLCKHYEVRPALKGFEGFGGYVCINTQGLIGHGLANEKLFFEGQILTLDFVIERSGFHADIAWTFVVDAPINEVQIIGFDHALRVSHECMTAKNGYLAPSLGRSGYRVLPHFAGHGIGRDIHEEPVFGYLEGGLMANRLERGTVFTVEPLIYEAQSDKALEPKLNEDGGWYLNSHIHSQFEFMLAIEEQGRILASRSEGFLSLCESIGRRP